MIDLENGSNQQPQQFNKIESLKKKILFHSKVFNPGRTTADFSTMPNNGFNTVKYEPP